MNLHLHRIAAILAFLAPVPLWAQGPIIVDAAGGGDFTELQPAIDAAEDGRLIRVRHGDYAGATITKSVRLVGDPYINLLGGGFTIVRVTSPLRIVGLPERSSVVITDFSESPGGGGFHGDLLIAEDCRGSIYTAYTLSGNLIFDRCDNVTVSNHATGDARFTDSTVIVSHSFFWGWVEPVMLLTRSKVTFAESGVNVVAFQHEKSLWIEDGSEFVYTADSSITGGNLVRPPAFKLSGTGTATEVESNFLSMDPQSLDSFSVKLTAPVNTSLVALGASLATQPSQTAQGELYLEPQSLLLYYLGALPASGDAIRRIPLPSILQPSRHFDANLPNRLAPDGSQLLGIPVVFQAALIVDGKAVLSLPFPMVL